MDWKVRALTLILWLGLVLASIQNGNAEKRVVCYYTNWSVYRPGTAKFSPQNINPYLCTHLIYAFGGFTKDNTLKPFDKYQDIEKGGYAKFTGLKTYNKNLKTLLAIGGWNEGSSRFSPMVADAHRRKEFVKNCVKFLRQNHFDGLDLDWEYPAFRDGGKPRDKENYAVLVEELREQFERESLKTGRPRLLLTMAMPAGIEYIDKGYDVPRLNENLDFINLLSYDYHSAFEPAVNHHSPLYPLEEDNEYNYDTELTIEYTVNHLIKQGASSEKIVLGIPTYGRSYTLFNEDSTDIGSPADGPGIEGDATREKGYLAYYEICENVKKGDWEVVQPNPEAMGPYAFKENQWVGYDDESIVQVKAKYVNEKNLGGIMFWSIDNDDFRGKCHGRPYPLIEAAKEALLASSSAREEAKEKPTLRKPPRIQSSQSNSSGRQYSSSNRRTSSTETPTRKRLGSSKSKNRSNVRVSQNDEDGEDTDLEEEEENDDEDDDRNSVKISQKPARSRLSIKNRPRSRSTESGGRRKQKNRDNKPVEDSVVEESLSNKLTTPEPPTTPDPGSDFKCEDEGFFPHPRDCKKYFWCLDSGPSGLGVVAHQFTCPSGLVFNKGADSCDYPRNVVCPKVKSGSEGTTTKAPTTAATIRTATRRTTTQKSEPEEEYEYEDEEEEEEEAPKTTAKPLLYKTISRNRPSSTTPSTVRATTTTSKPHHEASQKSLELAEEEDPKVIKELIDLIKKAGGIEHLEKQLLLQEKHVEGQSGTTVGSGQVTPATISRSLYERVLNRQASKVGSRIFGASSLKPPENKGKEEKEGNKRPRIGYTNGPGRSQFDGLDDLPEVKSLRRTNKPQYTTIERSRSSPSERIDENEDEEVSDDNADVASSEERSISNPPEHKSLLPRVTPSYVNIRRNHPATTSKDDNDVNVKEEEVEEERPTRRRFPIITTRTEKSISDNEDSKLQRYRPKPKNSTNDRHDEVQSPTESEESVKRTVFPNKKEDETSTSKFRYTSIHRFRSTTEKQEKSQNEAQETTSTPEVTTQTTLNTSLKDTTTPAPGSSTIPYTVSMTYSQSSSSSSSLSTSPLTTTSTTTENPTTQKITLNEEPTPSTKTTNPTITSSSERLVEDSATEILLTTSPFTSPSTTSTESTTKETLAAVSQPRPFGFTRGRTRSSQTSSFLDSTTPLSSSATVPSRSKVASSESFQLPTLKQLIGHQSDSTFSIYEENIRATKPSLPPSLSFPSKDNSLRRSFDVQEVVDIPIQILDDKEDDLSKLLLLRVPQNKLNRTILHTVLKIKVIDPTSLEKDGSSELEEVANVANTNLLTNELLMKERRALKGDREVLETESPIEFERSASTYRGRSNRRRPRVDASLSTSTEGSLSSQSLPLAQTTQDSLSSPSSQSITSVIQTTEDSLPANPRAADIERAKRRRIRLNSSQVTTGPSHSNPNSQVRRRLTRRRNKDDVSESTTTVRITTSRGSTLPSSTTPEIPRGFYLTRNIDEILVTQMNKVSSVGIQSTDPSSISTTEKTTFSTTMEPFTNSLSTRDYSESSTIINSPLIENKDQEGEFNFFVTTTEITQQKEEVVADKYLDDYFNPMETTTEISETTIPKLDDVNGINTPTSREIESVTERTASPHRYLRKKIRKIKPVSREASDLESFPTPSTGGKRIRLKKINIRFSTEATLDSTFTNPDSSSANPDSNFTNPDSNFTNPDSNSANPDSTFTNPDSTFTNPDSTFTNPDSTSTNTDSTFTNSDSTSANPDSPFTNSDSTFKNPDPAFITPDSSSLTTSRSTLLTTFESTTFATSDPTSFVTSTNSKTLATTDSISDSTLPTSESPSKDQLTSENVTDRENPDFKSKVTEASGSDTTTEDTLLRDDDFIKPNSNFVELNTDIPDSSTTKFYVDLPTISYDEFEKQNFELKDTPEIEDNDITTEKGYDSTSTNQILNTETTPMSIHQINDQNETSIFATSTTTSQSILPEANDISSLINNQQISTEKPTINTTKVIDESVSRTTRPTSNGRRRVLKRKRPIDQKLGEKQMEVAKTEAIEVTLEKSQDKSTTPATIRSEDTPETQKPTRKRVTVYRGTRKFTSRTTSSTTTVQSLPDTGDHQNQIAPRRRMRTVVRKRPKLPAADITGSKLSTLEDQSNRKEKDLSLDPETKSLDDAEEAGSEVNLYRTSAVPSRRPGSFHHREPNRIRGRASTYQPLTTTQPTLRRFASPARQTLHLEETTLPPKLRFASVDDAAVLLEHLARLEDQKVEMDGQANKAHEVVLEDPEPTTEPGDSSASTTFWRKISTTETPKTLATTAIPALRRRQGQKYFNKIVSQNLPQRPRRPAIIDYDYYEDEEVRFVGKPRLNGKLYVTSRGSISCLDQGNFPHPISCKKFITCARMVNGLVVGTEYTCPDKLSFDPIGGICNWSAGLGCKE